MAETSKLSETAKSIRKYIIGFLIFAVVVIIAQNLYHYIKDRNTPVDITNSPYQYIDNAFGSITYPTIPSLAIKDSTNPSYSVSGQLPSSPTSVNVYKTITPRETLSSIPNGIALAAQFGITQDYQMNQNTLAWQTNAKQTLAFNKVTQAVQYKNLGIDINILRANKPESIDIKSIESNIDSAASSLTQNSLSTITQIAYTQSSKLSYLIANGKGYQTTTNTEKSDYIRKDYYTTYEIVSLKANTSITSGAGNISNGTTGNLYNNSSDTTASSAQAITGRLYTDAPYEGSINITFANAETVYPENQTPTNYSNPELTKVREYNQNGIKINTSEKGTYGLITLEHAWEDAKDGKASLKYLVKQGSDPLADYTPLEVKRFILVPENCELGYYLTQNQSEYIYPIYVLKGTAELKDGSTADFIFYTKAIEG